MNEIYIFQGQNNGLNEESRGDYKAMQKHNNKEYSSSYTQHSDTVSWYFPFELHP